MEQWRILDLAKVESAWLPTPHWSVPDLAQSNSSSGHPIALSWLAMLVTMLVIVVIVVMSVMSVRVLVPDLPKPRSS
jgi:hypothetical protein